MIDIQTEEYYNTYMGLREFYRTEMYKRLGNTKNSLANRFDSDKALIAALDKTLLSKPKIINDIDHAFSSYASLRDKLNLRDWVFRKEKYSVVLNALLLMVCLILSPLFIIGLFNNWPHYFLPDFIVKKIKDTQFKSTAAWGSGMVIQAIYYMLLIILAVILFLTGG